MRRVLITAVIKENIKKGGRDGSGGVRVAGTSISELTPADLALEKEVGALIERSDDAGAVVQELAVLVVDHDLVRRH